MRGFGAKFLLLQTLEDSRPQFKDLLFNRGSPPCFLPFDLLLWDGKTWRLRRYPRPETPRLTLTTRILGTTSVQLRERNSGQLVPKRHRMKHLDSDLLLVRDQRVGGSNPLSPTILHFSGSERSDRRVFCRQARDLPHPSGSSKVLISAIGLFPQNSA